MYRIFIINRFNFIILVLFNIIPMLSLCKETDNMKFDGRRAYSLLKKQCNLGYRYPGSKGSELCIDFICDELKKLNITVKKQNFSAFSPLMKRDVECVNIIGIYDGDTSTSDILALSAHFDTRPVAEKDPDPAMRSTPIIGANDGASGVALLLELARILEKRKYPGKILFLFWDMEDSGIPGSSDGWCLGSEYFADKFLVEYPISAGINFDMIGDRDLKIQPELSTYRFAPEMTASFWGLAEKKAPFQFSGHPLEYSIIDDHTPFLSRGIPYINLIDFDFSYWHTQEDTPDKCSPISLQIVGNIAVEYIFQRWKNIVNNP
jgi:Zn-dependent M28 family amino/carboxypeptidase